MSKNINIDAHVKRYEQTELGDVVKLTDALKAMIERRKGDTIIMYEEKLALLKKGEIPAEQKPEPRTTRGGKKKAEQEAA